MSVSLDVGEEAVPTPWPIAQDWVPVGKALHKASSDLAPDEWQWTVNAHGSVCLATWG